MTQNNLQTAAERFEALFGKDSPERQGLPSALRTTVYDRMRYALMETDNRKFKRVKNHFLKTFHPDHPESPFTRQERQTVFVMLEHIFEGEPL
jgi:hypothetical protein